MSKNQQNQRFCGCLASRVSSFFHSKNRSLCASFLLSSPPFRNLVGVTGVEPVTLRLSSACSNQLSYTPGSRLAFRLNAGRS